LIPWSDPKPPRTYQDRSRPKRGGEKEDGLEEVVVVVVGTGELDDGMNGRNIRRQRMRPTAA